MTGVMRGGVAVLVALVMSAVVPMSATAQTFNYTGGEQSYTVPAGVYSLSVQANGAAGGSNDDSIAGGTGGQVTGVLGVTPGQTLYIEVGGVGGTGSAAGSTPGAGGFNGGGGSEGYGGGGGGASDVRGISCGPGCPGSATSLNSRLLVAGGGGGGGAGTGSGAGGAVGAAGGDGADTGNGGGGATTSSPGAGGDSTACTGAETSGSSGSLGMGGAGAADPSPVPDDGAGGGGGGEYGGGGGGSCVAAGTPNTGGGGGGASFADSSVSNATYSVASGAASVTITPVLEVNPSSLSYATQSQSTLSAPQTVTITNLGSTPISVTGLSFSGADSGDFLIGSWTCGGEIAPAGSCQVTVSFAPQTQGGQSAALLVATNEPASSASISLAGIGGPLPQGNPGTNGSNGTNGQNGATGATGAQGAVGPRGPQGPAGTPGQIDLLVCGVLQTKTIKVKGKKVKIKVRTCQGRLVTGKLQVIGGAADKVSLVRNGLTYASGTRVRAARGASHLELKVRRRMTAGTYWLTYRQRSGRRWSTVRERISLSW